MDANNNWIAGKEQRVKIRKYKPVLNAGGSRIDLYDRLEGKLDDVISALQEYKREYPDLTLRLERGVDYEGPDSYSLYGSPLESDEEVDV